VKVPNHKHQAPNKLQLPKLENQSFEFGDWDFEIYLGFGIWDFCANSFE
jgi:hypothetical protein